MIGDSPDECVQLNRERETHGNQVTFSLKDGLLHSSDYLHLEDIIKVSKNEIIRKSETCEKEAEILEKHLIDILAFHLDIMFFLHVCGYTADELTLEEKTINVKEFSSTDGTHRCKENEPTAPSSKRIIFPKGVTKEEELNNNDEHKISFELIDEAILKAKTVYPEIKPIRVSNRDMYVMYLHPTQTKQLRFTKKWKDYVCDRDSDHYGQKAIFDEIMNVESAYKGVCIGVYIYTAATGVILCESRYVTNGVNSDDNTPINNVRRAILLGAQSVLLGWSNNDPECIMGITDYDLKYSGSIRAIWGMKKARIKTQDGSEEDYGTIVIPTYVGE
ncbi:phage capsid family protein [Bartonella sp. CB60]|uniref:phage capsid family protein n=1 Tax=Bartonella sp. CB60 TaxID=3113619 RepID=UPI00300DC9FE